MLSERYFEEAFVIHEESEKEVDFVNSIIDYVNAKNDNKDLNRVEIDTETRTFLRTKWATKKRILNFQPIFEIKYLLICLYFI